MDSLDEHWGWFIDIELSNNKDPLSFPRKAFMESIDEEYEYYMSNRKMRSVSPRPSILPKQIQPLNKIQHVKQTWLSTLFTYLLHFIKWF